VPPVTVGQAAVVHAMLGDVGPARRDFPRLEKLAKDDKIPKEMFAAVQAYIHAADGKFDEALNDMQPFRKDDPRQAAIFLTVGNVQERAGRLDDAIASYKRVVDAAPLLNLNYQVTMTRVALARALKAKGDAAGAQAQVDYLTKQWANADADFALKKELDKIK
jgi:tetratricopeptide (TPR) repeat protein